MKKEAKLSELTLEELEVKKNKAKGAIIGLGIMMIVAIATLIYLALQNKNYALMAVAFGSSISFLPMMISFKQIQAEIKLRKSQS